jgi:hypothetical protein
MVPYEYPADTHRVSQEKAKNKRKKKKKTREMMGFMYITDFLECFVERVTFLLVQRRWVTTHNLLPSVL